MKRISIAFIIVIFAAFTAKAQVLTPVKWSVGSKKIDNEKAVVFIKASIENGWHIYGMQVPKGGPIATNFDFKKSNDFTLTGKTLEPKPQSKYEDIFKMTVPYHSKEVVFQQHVKLNKGKANVSGTVEFMACDKNQCLPPDEYNFTVAIK